MNRRKLSRSGARAAIAGLAVVVAMLIGSVPVASAHQGQSGAPGKLPGHRSGSDHHHHHGAPGNGGHVGAPGS